MLGVKLTILLNVKLIEKYNTRKCSFHCVPVGLDLDTFPMTTLHFREVPKINVRINIDHSGTIRVITTFNSHLSSEYYSLHSENPRLIRVQFFVFNYPFTHLMSLTGYRIVAQLDNRLYYGNGGVYRRLTRDTSEDTF